MRSHAQAERQSFEYWKDRSVAERFVAAAYLNSIAYGFPQESPPRLDKTVHKTRKH